MTYERAASLDHFEELGHTKLASSSLVPANDPTLLFVNSGMVQFKEVFLGSEQRAYKRATTSQKSLRIAGKHNDLEEVGVDTYHHTMFEMLGNWSLGDYFKKEQLSWIWEFLTKEIKLPKEKLYVYIFEGNNNVPKDTESYEIWKNLGLSEDHIFEYGVKKNWWSRSGTPDEMPEGAIRGKYRQ